MNQKHVFNEPATQAREKHVFNEPGIQTREKYMFNEPGTQTREKYVFNEPGTQTREYFVFNEPGTQTRAEFVFDQQQHSLTNGTRITKDREFVSWCFEPQKQRRRALTVTLIWHMSKYIVNKFHQDHICQN